MLFPLFPQLQVSDYLFLICNDYMYVMVFQRIAVMVFQRTPVSHHDGVSAYSNSLKINHMMVFQRILFAHDGVSAYKTPSSLPDFHKCFDSVTL